MVQLPSGGADRVRNTLELAPSNLGLLEPRWNVDSSGVEGSTLHSNMWKREGNWGMRGKVLSDTQGKIDIYRSD